MNEDLINEINAVAGNEPANPVNPPTEQSFQPAEMPVDPIPVKAPDFSKTKTKKGKTIAIIISIAVLLAAGASVATMYFLGVFKPAERTPDDAAIEQISEKMSFLLGEKGSSEVISKTESNYLDSYVFNGGEISDETMVWLAFDSLEAEKAKKLTDEQLNAAFARFGELGFDVEDRSGVSINAFDGELIRVASKNVFGVEPGELPAERTVQYNAEGDYYYMLNYGNFESENTRYYRKQRYVEDNEKISVYVSSAQFNIIDKKIYCGTFAAYEEERFVECDTIRSDIFDANIITEDKYHTRRFDFKKVSDGEYSYAGSSEVFTPKKEEVESNIVEEPQHLESDETEPEETVTTTD